MKMVLIGAGQRGRIYADYIHDKGYADTAAIVEPDAERRAYAAEYLGVRKEYCFESEEELWRLGNIADVAIIATMDRDHYRQAMKALEFGYDLILEKPISHDAAECLAIRRKAEETGRKVVVCHVLRYTPFFTLLKYILDSGELGRIISIRHEENIGNFHMAHSFVRGNWRRVDSACPIILAKSCHDMDILVWLTGSCAKSISSVGGLKYFTLENAPKNSAERCADCAAEGGCRFSAYKCYMSMLGEWPATVVSLIQTEDEIKNALAKGPYGRCVYRCDNDVCDNQTTLIEFENSVAVNFGMSAFTNRMNRDIRVLCEDGEISGDDESGRITITRFASNSKSQYEERIINAGRARSGHGGGDTGIVDEYFKTEAQDGTEVRSSIAQSVESHIMAFAAEKSRLENGARVDVAAFRENLLKSF
ncbi:MAG: Gfo/Idh/MocA family oxidoreductase [Oscillospiraceae bacterium]|nr:Gfo/Idh/MocA family oxidoreductase [Oscillospiraceae bacterium]